MEYQRAARARITVTHGSIESYISELLFIDIDRPRSASLPDFYALYSKTFALAEEREPLLGFETVLAFNRQPRAQADAGPFYEAITIMREPDEGGVVAAANYTIMSYPGRQPAFGYDGSCQLNF